MQATEQQIAVELDAIKRLLILALLRQGVKQDEIASALRVSQSTISKMFPGGLKIARDKK
jgi:predicted XRE-type DNA-binding protein